MNGWAERIEETVKRASDVSGKYKFIGSCISMDGRSIGEMQEVRKPVSLRTIRKYCDTKPFEDALGYVRGGDGLRLSKDWHVGFYKSCYEGMSVYYIEHSRIEYIWAKA